VLFRSEALLNSMQCVDISSAKELLLDDYALTA